MTNRFNVFRFLHRFETVTEVLGLLLLVFITEVPVMSWVSSARRRVIVLHLLCCPFYCFPPVSSVIPCDRGLQISSCSQRIHSPSSPERSVMSNGRYKHQRCSTVQYSCHKARSIHRPKSLTSLVRSLVVCQYALDHQPTARERISMSMSSKNNPRSIMHRYTLIVLSE